MLGNATRSTVDCANLITTAEQDRIVTGDADTLYNQ